MTTFPLAPGTDSVSAAMPPTPTTPPPCFNISRWPQRSPKSTRPLTLLFPPLTLPFPCLLLSSATLAAVAEEEYATEDNAPGWYAITKGHYVGVTLSNPLALVAVVGISTGSMKKYKMQVHALRAFNKLLQYNLVSVNIHFHANQFPEFFLTVNSVVDT
ncbi:hypothetical protein C8R46DRAFT_1220388 [Mycena filopes]|nr:hypothetical protein C8R46DRAFT_1220388 [Mycena filopes]